MNWWIDKIRSPPLYFSGQANDDRHCEQEKLVLYGKINAKDRTEFSVKDELYYIFLYQFEIQLKLDSKNKETPQIWRQSGNAI